MLEIKKYRNAAAFPWYVQRDGDTVALFTGQEDAHDFVSRLYSRGYNDGYEDGIDEVVANPNDYVARGEE